jgi:hypothetical protein
LRSFGHLEANLKLCGLLSPALKPGGHFAQQVRDTVRVLNVAVYVGDFFRYSPRRSKGMKAIYGDQPLTSDTFTLEFSFKFALIYVPTYGTRTNADGLRHPSRLAGQVRVFCPRASACVVLSHEGYARPLGVAPKALRSEPRASGDTFYA